MVDVNLLNGRDFLNNYMGWCMIMNNILMFYFVRKLKLKIYVHLYTYDNKVHLYI